MALATKRNNVLPHPKMGKAVVKPIDLYYDRRPTAGRFTIMLEECRLSCNVIAGNISRGDRRSVGTRG